LAQRCRQFFEHFLEEAAAAASSCEFAKISQDFKEKAKPCFLSCFSGEGKIAEEARKVGFDTLEIDIIHGTLHDMTRPSVVLGMLVLLMFGCVDCIGLDVCCQSWSRARRWDGGPPPLRTDTGDQLYGRMFLNKPDSLKVQLGNILLIVTGFISIASGIFNMSGYVENPLSSRIWLTYIMKDAAFICKAHHKVVHYCMYGTRWKKPTCFMVWVDSFVHWKPQLCDSNRKCLRTGQRHIILSGKVKGKYRTILAQQYPAALCAEIVSFMMKR